jgi:RluA family pseudouridine synthase
MHPSGRFNKNTLQSILNEVYQPQRLRPVHRLDANTSGVVIFARTRAVARKIQPQFESRDVEKMYLARVLGHPAQDEFRSDTPIGQETEQAGLRLPSDEGLSASTEFRVLERHPDGTSLIEAKPLTGRTNQIRIHLWDLNHPICGDPAYLPERQLGATQTLSPDDPPMCLHAWKIAFQRPEGERIEFEAEPPAWP